VPPPDTMKARMEHLDIDEGAWPERYVTGRLDAEERQRFEAHFIDCPACLDRIQAAERMKAGLRAFAPARPLEQAPVRHVPQARWAIRARWLATGACAAGLLAALVWQQAHRAESALTAERSASAEARRQLADAQRAAQVERSERQRLEASLSQERRPPVRIPVLSLITTRSGDAPELELPGTPQPVVFSVEREDPPRFATYRATLRSPEGEALWQDQMRPSSRDAVVFALHSSLLAPASYMLVLEGAGKGDRWTTVGRHAFRAVSARPVQ
jgi:hypothetical protein